MILYKWIEEYEPALFRRIQGLVGKGKWHIMGGWYLQPDCNMPSGESFVRQILLGRRYFKEKFGVTPATAVNFDSFGHSRGLVQILKKSGFDSYLFCRPQQCDCPLPSDDFIWVGYDGSEILSHRSSEHYLSLRGEARSKVEKWMEEHKDIKAGAVLWGIGNHGGGPSRVDLQKLNDLMKETAGCEILHSTPESYFHELRADYASLPKHAKDINPFDIGCYTSQIRVKQKHRMLENEIYMLEKMMSSAAMQGLLKYPETEIHEAVCDLMVSEFHDPSGVIHTACRGSHVEAFGPWTGDHGQTQGQGLLCAGRRAAKGERRGNTHYGVQPASIQGEEYHFPVQCRRA